MNEANNLCLFFSLDNALPAAGYLRIGIPSASGFTPTGGALTSGVHVWALTTSFAVPTTVANAGTCGSFANNQMDCTFATALAANTAYGMVVPGATMATTGTWAPVTLETRMNDDADAGPVMDVNRVFDAIVVQPAAATITLAAT